MKMHGIVAGLATLLMGAAAWATDGQPLYFASTADSGNLRAGRYRIELVFPDGHAAPASLRPTQGEIAVASADGAITVAPGLWEADVPEAAQNGRLHLIPVDAAADSVPALWQWHPTEDADGGLWFEMPRRVIQGASLPGVSVDLAWADDGKPLANLRTDANGNFGFNLPAGEGAEREKAREVRWSITGPGMGTGKTPPSTGVSSVAPGAATHTGMTTMAFTSPGTVPTPGVPPCLGVYPNPWRPATSTAGYVVFFGLKPGDGVDIYTITGEKVRTLGGPYETDVVAPYASDPRNATAADPDLRNWGYILWDGRNTNGHDVANGVYLFVVNLLKHQCDGQQVVKGRITVIR